MQQLAMVNGFTMNKAEQRCRPPLPGGQSQSALERARARALGLARLLCFYSVGAIWERRFWLPASRMFLATTEARKGQ